MSALVCEVLVVGGGAAGVAAAVAAGRAGARVVILERYGFLGGLATAGQVGTVAGLYLRDGASSQPTLVANGFLREFSSRLAEYSGSPPVPLAHGLWVLPFRHAAFAGTADSFVSQAGNVEVVLHATLADVTGDAGYIREVRVLAWNDRLVINPQYVVDATGEATVAALAGAPAIDRISDQAPALVFEMGNVEGEFGERAFLGLLRDLCRAVKEGRLPHGCERLALVPRSGRAGRVAFKLNLPPATSGRPSWQQVTAWERGSRALASEIARFVVEAHPAFRCARCSHIAPQIGVRSGRCIRGVDGLQDEQVRSCWKSNQGIARGAWPMERWLDQPGPVLDFFAERDFYEIPLGALSPTGLKNVIAAGRCISATSGALSSARVIGTCLGTGWAAGRVAAAAVDGQPVDAVVSDLREQLAA
jgi:hypothetical protein